jgi:hypothetical protein
MHNSTIAVILALAAATVASPIVERLAPRQNNCKLDTVAIPDVNDVVKSINQWVDDVTTVNSFLDIINQITDADVIMADTQAVSSLIPYSGT